MNRSESRSVIRLAIRSVNRSLNHQMNQPLPYAGICGVEFSHRVMVPVDWLSTGKLFL